MKKSFKEVGAQRELIEYHFRVGNKHFEQENHELAIKHFSSLHELVPTEIIYTEKLAESHFLQAQSIEPDGITDLELALTHFEKAYEFMPTNYIYTYSLATALFELGQTLLAEGDSFGEEAGQALVHFKKAHALVPFADQPEGIYNKSLAEAHSLCGIALLELGAGDLSSQSLWSEMFVHLKTAYTLFPTNATYARTLAEGQYDFAQEIRDSGTNLMSYSLDELGALKIEEALLPYYPKDDEENEGLTPFLFETIGHILLNGYMPYIIQVPQLGIFPPGLIPLIEAYADFQTPLELAGAATETDA